MPILSKLATFLSATALALAPLQVPGQTSASYRIAGHIVSASDGNPLPRASVKIYTTGDKRLIASTTADQEGAFAFPAVKAGAYVLEGSAFGYIAARYLEHDGFNTAIITGAGVDTESLVLKLTRKASISGRVTDQNGDPVRNASMVLYREIHDNGLTRIARNKNAQADDTGSYEITDLAPGKYFLSAAATPWYAVRPQQPAANEGLGIVPGIDPSIDAAYPLTFYSEVTDSSQATPIVLRAGEQPEINLRLNALPALSVSIGDPQTPAQSNTPTPRQQNSDRAFARQVQVFKSIFGNLEPIPSELRVFPNGSMSLLGLAPGQYILKQVAPQGGAVRVLNVNLTGQAVTVDPGRGQQLGSLQLEVKTTDGTKPSQPCQFMLMRKDSTDSPSASTNPQGMASFNGVEPGDYSIDVFTGTTRAYVAGLVSGGKALPANHLHIVPGANPSVTLTIAPATGTLSGFARKDGKPAPGAMILLLPADPAERTRQTWRDQSDLDGSFHLTGVPPGRYIVLALDDAWDLDFQREGALDHYLPLATPITVPASANTALKLPVPLIAQSR